VYTQFDEAVATVLRAGPHCLLVKRDLADAFRHIPVHPDDWWLLGFRRGEAFHQDLFLPFGLRTLPAIFDFFATALVWIARCKVQMQHIQHYLDNFLMVIPAGSDARPQPQGFLLREHLRGRWLPHEGLSLTRRLWKHDSPEQSTSKPSNWSMRHCAALLSLVMSWTHWSGFSRSCPAQSPPVVLFLRRLYDAQGTRNPQPRRLSSSATLGTCPSKQRSSVTSSGGKSSYLNGTAYASSSLHAFRPTCGRTPPAQKASAATSSSSPQSGTPAAMRSSLLTHGASAAQEEAINYKAREMFAIPQALQLWLASFAGRQVHVYCDNDAIVAALRKQIIRGNAISPLRKIAMIAALHDVQLTAQDLPALLQ
jgi:hypothetical protein